MRRVLLYIITAFLAATAADAQEIGQYLVRAQAGDKVAEYNAGICCKYGYGTPVDEVEAFRWFRRSAEQGYVRSQTQVGILCHDGYGGLKPNPAAAILWHTKAAEQGSALSQYLLGCQFLVGDGTPQDSAQAAYWIERAAGQNLPEALSALGRCYAEGIGVPTDATKAACYLRRGAEAGDKNASRVLAEHYKELSLPLAKHWEAEQKPQPSQPETGGYSYESFDNGCYYGELRRGERDGCGTYAWDSGTLYTGEWEEGRRYGTGMTAYGSAVHYGAYSIEANGYGALIMTDHAAEIGGCNGGKRYVGYFSAGKPDGTGSVYDADGRLIYYGRFAEGRPSDRYPSEERYSAYAWVTVRYANGDIYEGETTDGLREGFGIYRWADGAVWSGSWSGGTRYGEGMYISPEGRIVAGTWSGNEIE